MPASSPKPLDRHVIRTIIAASIGAVFEWYDLLIYAMFVPTLSKLFFPTADPTVGVLLGLSTFASAWLVRPLGAMVIGSYADKVGRKPAMVMSALLMMVGTGLTGLLPGYASIGIAAPALLVFARLIQGFSAGGEFGSATALLAEQDPARSGFYVSIQWACSGFAVFIASLVAYAVNTLMSPEDVLAWGWRVPFLVGLLIGPVAWYIRSRADESPLFATNPHASEPLREIVTFDKQRVLIGAGVVAAGAAGSFMNQYMPTFAITSMHLSASQALIGTLVAGLINSVAPMISGHLSDRYGRIRLMAGFGVIGLLMTYPLFLWIIDGPTLTKLIVIQSLLALVIYSGYFAIVPALLSDLFQVRRRTTRISLAYVLGQLLFGGVTPLVAGLLVRQTGNPASPGMYLTVIIALSLACLTQCRKLGVK